MQDKESEPLAIGFAMVVREGERKMVEGALLSVTAAQDVLDPRVIQRFRKAGFEILAADNCLHVLPPLPEEE